eukprot:GFUD01132006.1.p1 GENE.GFUD01132006.1~~GFUD01132006.1.p1  ORF type:complete len:158 (+),score=27.70 GFUD01132006.1:40-513(+)
MTCSASCGEAFTSSLMAKVQAVLGGLIAITGVAMVVAGIVVVAIDCSMEKNWVLLVWGVVTLIMYGLVSLAGISRLRAIRGQASLNPCLEGLQHIASSDGGHAWWFAKEIVEAYTDTTGCRETPDTIALVLMSVRLGLCVIYGLIILFIALRACCKK